MTLYEVQVNPNQVPGIHVPDRVVRGPLSCIICCFATHINATSEDQTLALWCHIGNSRAHRVIKFLGKKARKAKAWLKQLSTSSDQMDSTEHDLIYYGLEKRIRKVSILHSYLLRIITLNSDLLGILRSNCDWPTCVNENRKEKLTY